MSTSCSSELIIAIISFRLNLQEIQKNKIITKYKKLVRICVLNTFLKEDQTTALLSLK